MKTATRLLCTTLLAALGMGLAQAAPMTGTDGPGSRGNGNGNAPDLEYGYCSPDSGKITGFARCDSSKGRGPQAGPGLPLDFDAGDERQDWQEGSFGPPLPGDTNGGLRVDVPEPPAVALLGLGLVALGVGRRRAQNRG